MNNHPARSGYPLTRVFVGATTGHLLAAIFFDISPALTLHGIFWTGVTLLICRITLKSYQ